MTSSQNIRNLLDSLSDHERTLHGDTWSKVAGIHMAGNVLNMLKLDKQAALVRRLVRKTQDGTVGKVDDMPDEEDTEVRIGDETHLHLPQQKDGGGLSGTTKLALSALLGGAVASMPMWGPVVLGMFGGDEQQEQPAEPQPGVNLEGGGLELEIVRPDV